MPSTCGGCNRKAARKNSADLCQALHHGMIKQESGAIGVLVCHARTVALPSFICPGCSGSKYLRVCRITAQADSKDAEFLFQFRVKQNFMRGICSYLKETVLTPAKK